MQIILSDFMTLDGVVQAPGGPDEDTDRGFPHGGWSMTYFDPQAMGPVIDEVLARTEALLFGRRTWQAMAAAWPGRAGDAFADRMNKSPNTILLGGGQRIFPEDGRARPLELVSTTTASTGVLICTYRPARG